MSDFDLSRLPDLLARLDGRGPCEVEYLDGQAVAYASPDIDGLFAERAEAASAIRALLESRDNAERAASHAETKIKLAVATEREACARVCRDRADFNQREAKSTGRTLFVDRYQEALECEAAIRARGGEEKSDE